MATPERFELPTVSLGRTCSIQLSYGANRVRASAIFGAVEPGFPPRT